MGKGSKVRGSGRQKDDDDDPESDDNNTNCHATLERSTSPPKLDFQQRRELQRKAAAEKRRSKQRCHVCGQTGHVRRECPGIADGGRGASKYTKSKGDHGATLLNSSKKGARNRGRKPKTRTTTSISSGYVLPGFPPQGFSPAALEEEGSGSEEEASIPFLFYDTGCDIMAAIPIASLRSGKKKLSTKEAVSEYQSAFETVSSQSNFGGCLARSTVRPGRPWNREDASPLVERNDVWFIVGLGRDFLYNDTDHEAALNNLVNTCSNDCRVVGVFCDLDYRVTMTSRAGCDRESQLRRLRCTYQAAGEAGLPIQIRTSPGVPRSDENTDESSRLYADAMKDLEEFLSRATTDFPSLKVHLSCWSGSGDHMFALLKSFSENVWIGFDATVSFAKAAQVRESAFDVPMQKVLLETGANTIPTVVARSIERGAFSHSGHIPYVAQALAEAKSSQHVQVTAVQVARAASTNTVLVYAGIEGNRPLSVAS